MLALPIALVLSLGPKASEIEAIRAQGKAAFAAKDFDRASRAFADAYVLDPQPDLLYNRAQAERLAGRCNVAVGLYEQFLKVEPASTQVAADARLHLAKCKAAAPSDAAANGASQDGGTPRTPSQRPRKQAAWYRDPAGGVLVALGGVSVVIGGSVLGIALSRDKKAADAANEGGFVDRKDSARTQHRVGIAVLSIGGALLVAGIVRWAVVASKGQRTPPSNARVGFGVAPARRGAAVSLGMRF
ncbi:MAG TPA: hypothetical protein VG755_38710 [Nannocystaceae bacterium]|nr:hypothetical protein [Nannocystaceae bacterium]